MSESRRLIDLLAATERFFQAKGIESPRRNAEALFAHALCLKRIDLYVHHDRPLSDAEVLALRELIRRRGQREPLQYVLGSVPFCDATIILRPGQLVPRPETEEMVLALAKRIPPDSRILDIGCGTGCISTALAMLCPTCTVVGADIDQAAIEETLFNARKNGVPDRVSAVRADLFDERFVEVCSGPFDVVVSNPPYVREDEWQGLQTEVRDFENKHALVSGPTGLECYERFAELLPSLLKPTGLLALEFGFDQAASIRDLFTPLLSEIDIHRDLQGKERFLIGRR
ncbi:MAG: peptide chain release factor N(5)-glutamine methyltransferase [Calditrichaeota bacterium]|nr:peptide chain release factor N(5)-glutamine methyltransferase [Calditrichota bacterium]MCB9391938.1 peptide chain release factor N(5)-glutamine methyltransferase [Calditrichota bacterium]